MLTKRIVLLLSVFIAIVNSSIIQEKNGDNLIENYNDIKESKKSNNLIVGSRVSGDRLTLQEYVYKSSSTLQIVTLEKNFTLAGNERITQIMALDQKTNGNGAFASLLQGGPGTNSAILRFKSQRGHSIKFEIQIYSKQF
ncbi:probable salivary secreted peptide [Aphidius gifuensis]|uniref:probable salivary secreted peptide n=1 Tax=Aphidius gifuensis TaxID=684658 RepID=UPI001CDBB62B|nr:probable salivary secreted peptide [Aphidius gifuensis]